MRAILRWALADLRTHRGQAATLTLATAGVTAALLLSAALLQFAASPWQQLFTETRGHHIWLRLSDDADTRRLARLDGVQRVSGPYATASLTVAVEGSAGTGAGSAAVSLRATGPDGVRDARLVSGARLSGAEGEVLLDRATAEALWARPGDRLTVRESGAGGGVRKGSLRVAGIVATAEAGYDAGERPGIAWASPGTVDRQSAGSRPGRTAGLRLDDPADTGFVVQQAVAAVGPEHVVQVSTWLEARASFADDHQPAGRLLRVFGLGALLAAAVAVTGGVGSRVLGQLRDISALKAIGMTPAQIAVMFFGQHTALALAGAVAGSLAVRTLGPLVPGPVGEAVVYSAALPGAGGGPVRTGAATVLVIAAATALAAWRAARVSPSPAVRAARPAPRRMSRAARAALRRGVPPQLVLGWRGAVHRRVRFAAGVVRLAVPVGLITVALSAVTTLDALNGGDGGRAGPSAPLTVRQEGGLSTSAVDRLGRTDGVRTVYPAAEVTALIPGQTRSVTLRGRGTANRPYPFAAVEGRTPSASHEAVAGQGMLDATRTEVGQWVRLTVGGTPHILHIVGRSIEPEHGGVVVTTTLDTLRENGTARGPQAYAVLPRPGADPDALASALSKALPGGEVRRAPPPVPSAPLVGGVLAGLIGVLALIAVAELASSVGSAVWHHARELPALRAVGLTPGQLAGTIVAHCAVTAGAAAVTGTAAGLLAARPLIDLEGGASGVGAGMALPPPTALLLLTGAGLVAAAIALASVPALRAERRRTPDPAVAAG
ncbi:FtsX-like permease family protein [Streptomyces sp. NPDC014894]|uniref:FtsX-like permease family protein n=1 Tax=Streptomyces sp. NPDC014894 TaxID=3364931 RepID=UPI0036F83F74